MRTGPHVCVGSYVRVRVCVYVCGIAGGIPSAFTTTCWCMSACVVINQTADILFAHNTDVLIHTGNRSCAHSLLHRMNLHTRNASHMGCLDGCVYAGCLIARV